MIHWISPRGRSHGHVEPLPVLAGRPLVTLVVLLVGRVVPPAIVRLSKVLLTSVAEHVRSRTVEAVPMHPRRSLHSVRGHGRGPEQPAHRGRSWWPWGRGHPLSWWRWGRGLGVRGRRVLGVEGGGREGRELATPSDWRMGWEGRGSGNRGRGMLELWGVNLGGRLLNIRECVICVEGGGSRGICGCWGKGSCCW